MTRVSDIGEFGLIERIRKAAGKGGRQVLQGIGDDACLFRLSRGQVGLATVDTLVQDRHFDLAYTSYFDLGWKAMAANLSDIAAMGGRPLLALISVTLTRRQTVEDIDELHLGLQTLARKHSVSISGGDTVRGRELSVTIAVIGECARGNAGLRSGVRPGDAVLVTGTLGASRAGLEIIKAKFKSQNSKLTAKHLRPEPRVREGMLLSRNFGLHGVIDVSDGLAAELWHLSRESRVGIVIDQGALPVDQAAIQAAGLLGRDPMQFCLEGGEEYELVFTLPAKQAVSACQLLNRTGCPCRVIGQAVRGRGVRMAGRDGIVKHLADRGYRHF